MSAQRDFNKIRSTGLSRFMRAIERGDASTIEEMIYMGADVNAKTKKPTVLAKLWWEIPHSIGSTPLHLAASGGDIQIIQLLIRARGNINAKNDSRSTPLDNALLVFRHFETILDKRLNTTIKSKKKISTAQKNVARYKDVIHFMVKNGAKTGLLQLPDDFKAPEQNTRPQDGLRFS